MVSGPTKPETKSRKKKKKVAQGKKSVEDGIRLKKLHREPEIPVDEDEEY